jgi:hypothetical protein
MRNNWCDVQGISNLSRLQFLGITGRQPSFDFLASLSALVFLHMDNLSSYGHATRPDPQHLLAMTRLRVLSIPGVVVDLDTLRKMTQLRVLTIGQAIKDRPDALTLDTLNREVIDGPLRYLTIDYDGFHLAGNIPDRVSLLGLSTTREASQKEFAAFNDWSFPLPADYFPLF